MKYFMLFCCLVFSSASFASFGELRGCGEYEISGIVVKDPSTTLKILVNEGSKSEYQIFVSSNDLASISGFINRDVSFNGEIIGIDGTKLQATNLIEFKNRVPNPLELKGSTGFKLIKNKDCSKWNICS